MKRTVLSLTCFTLQPPCEKLSNLLEDTINHSESLEKGTYENCDKSLGFSTKKHQDWFDENEREIQVFINIKRKAFTVWQNDINPKQKQDSYCHIKYERSRRIFERERTSSGRTNQNRFKRLLTATRYSFLSTIKAIYGPTTQGTIPLRARME